MTTLVWVYSYTVYAHALLRRKVTPALGFWFTSVVVNFALLPPLIKAGLLSISLLQISIWCIGSTIITVLVWRQRGVFRLDRLEITCLGATVLSQIALHVVKDPNVAIGIQTLAFVASSVPFCRNALHGRERWQSTAPAVCGSLVNFGTIQAFDAQHRIILTISVIGAALNTFGLICCVIAQKREPLKLI